MPNGEGHSTTMKATIAAPATIAVSFALGLLTACSPKDSTPTVSGTNPTVTVQAECDEDGVANVAIKFGEVDDKFLIGKNAITQTFAGGRKKVDRSYQLASGYEEVPLTVTTSPTTGTCRTVITDYESGNVVAERDTAGKAELTVTLKNSK